MTKEKVDMFIMMHGKEFPASKIFFIKEKLMSLPEEKEAILNSIELKSPTTNLIVSLLAGGLGIDRFLLGDVGMGVLKLLTGGLCGILTIIDWFTIQNKTKKYNLDLLLTLL